VAALDQEVVEAEIELALRDAGLSRSRATVLVHDRAYSREGKPSGHFRPSQRAELDDDLGLRESDLVTLNDQSALALHRLVVYADYGPEPEGRWLFAGLLRHELEHARQWEDVGDAAFGLSRLIDDIHYARFAEAPEEKYLYRAKPDEQDANAAAASYLARRFPDAPRRLHTDEWYPLVWSYTKPEATETLVARSVCFLFQYVSLCEHVAEEKGKTFAEMLEEITPSAAHLWHTLVGHP
jgi:hypothetical protein